MRNRSLAADDEAIGRRLLEDGAHRQATYLFVQAMEKYVRAEVQAHVKAQVRDFVLDGVRFHDLHNDLRYPIPIRGGEIYATLHVDRRAAEIVLERLDALKNFLRDMDRLTH